MSATTVATRDVETSLTYFNYQSEKSLEIDFTKPGSDVSYGNLQKLSESYKVTVHDARGKEDQFSLEKNGFVYAKHDMDAQLAACKTEEEVKDLLVPATEQLVKDVTGAHKTIVFTSRIRNISEDGRERADNRAPALSVHSDFSPEGGLHNVETLVKDVLENEKLSNSRIILINVWRPLKTIKKDPLAVCDWSSVNLDSEIIPLRFKFPTQWNELGWWRHTDNHKWYYLNNQQPSEPLLFMQYDSRGQKGAMTLPHTAFQDPEFLNEAPRESIEIKMLAFID